MDSLTFGRTVNVIGIDVSLVKVDIGILLDGMNKNFTVVDLKQS